MKWEEKDKQIYFEGNLQDSRRNWQLSALYGNACIPQVKSSILYIKKSLTWKNTFCNCLMCIICAITQMGTTILCPVFTRVKLFNSNMYTIESLTALHGMGIKNKMLILQWGNIQNHNIMESMLPPCCDTSVALWQYMILCSATYNIMEQYNGKMERMLPACCDMCPSVALCQLLLNLWSATAISAQATSAK